MHCHRFSKGKRRRELIFGRRQQWCSVTWPANQSGLSPERCPSGLPLRRAHPERRPLPHTGITEVEQKELDRAVSETKAFFSRIMQLTTVISSHQFLTQPPAPPPPPPPPPPPLLNGSASSPLPKTVTSGSSRHSAGQVKVRRSLKLPVDFRDFKMILTVISIYGNAVAHQNPLLISSFPSPPYFSWFSDCSLRPRRVQTALHRDLRKQRTANQRSEVFVLLSF